MSLNVKPDIFDNLYMPKVGHIVYYNASIMSDMRYLVVDIDNYGVCYCNLLNSHNKTSGEIYEYHWFVLTRDLILERFVKLKMLKDKII